MKKKVKKLAPRRPTILDVAAALNVSGTTVSRGLRDLEGVSELLRDQIKQKAAELGYFPNLAGSALSTGKTRSIIYLLPFTDFPNLLQMQVLEGLINETSTRGFNVTIVSEQYLRSLEGPISQSLKAINADGCVSLFLRAEDPALGIDQLHFPVIVVNKVIKAQNADFVITDDERGAYLATEHLIHNGHKRIVYLRGPSDNFNVRKRLKGYKQALVAHGLKFENELVQPTDLSRNSGASAMFRLLNGQNLQFTAVSACNDAVALGALDALKASGLRVPNDISLVGFDDESFSAVIDPALTTIAKPRYEMGRAAGRLLLDRIEDRYSGPQRTVMLHTELICRRSSAKLDQSP